MSTSLALSRSARRTFEIIQSSEQKEHKKEIQNKIASIHFGIREGRGKFWHNFKILLSYPIQ